MRRIEVNNGCSLEIVQTRHGIAVHHRNENNTITDIDTFDDAEIVMALNLLRYMRDQDSTCAYVMPYREEEGQRFFRNNIHYGDLVEFRIFQ